VEAQPLLRKPVIDYACLGDPFLRHWTLGRVAQRIPPSTRAHVRVRQILRALADVEESEREFRSSWSAYRRTQWCLWGTAACGGCSFLVSCAYLFADRGGGQGWIVTIVLLVLCALFVVGIVPEVRRLSSSLLERSLSASEALQEAERSIDALIRQPFAADPWAPLRATVPVSRADSGQKSFDTVNDNEE
jgi:hypothetical protein